MKQSMCMAAVCCLAAASASAGVAYNNFGSGEGGFEYGESSFYNIRATNTGIFFPLPGVRQGFRFTAQASGGVTDVWIPLQWHFFLDQAVYPDEVNVYLGAASDPDHPERASTIATWTLNNDTMPSDNPIGVYKAPVHLVGLGEASLTEGQDYWIWVEATNETTEVAWRSAPGSFAAPSDSLTRAFQFYGPAAAQFGGEDWQTDERLAGAFRIDVIPAPGTIAVAAFGLAGLGRRRH